MEAGAVKKAVDGILLDLPSSPSILAVNGLTAADEVIIPSRPTMLDISGLNLFLETVKKAQGRMLAVAADEKVTRGGSVEQQIISRKGVNPIVFWEAE